jgi:hypothetical protein
MVYFTDLLIYQLLPSYPFLLLFNEFYRLTHFHYYLMIFYQITHFYYYLMIFTNLTFFKRFRWHYEFVQGFANIVCY